MRILKFPLEPFGTTEIQTRGHLNVLTVGVDGKNQPCIWVEADVGDTTKTIFESVVTGGDVPQDTKEYTVGYEGTIFIKTWEADLPLYVMHIYQRYPKPTAEDIRRWSQVNAL